jgi:hypothetical protein
VLRPVPAIFDTFACLDDAARFEDARLDNWTFRRFDVLAAALASMLNFDARRLDISLASSMLLASLLSSSSSSLGN